MRSGLETMRVTYDPSVDAAYIQITSSKGGVETTLVDDHVAVDIDSERRVVGVEILDASSRLDPEDLKSFDFEVYGESYGRHLQADTTAVREDGAGYESTEGSEGATR